ncbi:DNA-binding protein RFX5 isoform X2 [Podarcis raffonei]|uniref:DNA-binding protein RFX5 isoform X2 n=1 Tax=Podarcis raffonei TaxID=65483 RepID=UPI0023299BEB|nr:DNA-binding protein RFX5 isoform X2 [Podarcis raffonei]
MADDNGLYTKIAENVSESLEADPQGVSVESSTLLQKLRGTISKSVQCKIDYILQDVQRFTDHAKLYLYLQLPSGPSSGEKNLDLTSLSSAEHMHACTWIRNHLEEYPDTCLPKQDVFDAYKRYCDNLCSRSLSAANFGKIIREIFPNIKARRLGGRGQSKYPFVGIRRKTVVNMPPLPSLDLKETESPERPEVFQSYSDEVMEAACALTCDWAEKILKRSFNNIVEVAQFLIQQHIISSRSPHVDLIMAMVVSEITENHRDKRPPQTMKKNEPEGVESSDNKQTQAKAENAAKPSAAAPRSEAKKPPDAPAKPASSPQINALVARLPLLLPRVQVQPGDRLVVSPGVAAMHPAPAVLAPKLTASGGTVKMALSMGPGPSTLVAPAMNGLAGVVSPPGAVPVINMMPVINMAPVPPVAEIPLKHKSAPAGGGVNGCEAQRSPQDPQRVKPPAKRPAEAPGEATAKRKRGRPRKKADPPSPEKRTAKEGAPGAEEDSDIIVVTVGYGDQAARPSSRSASREESTEVEVVHVGKPKSPFPQETSEEGPSRAGSLIVSPVPKAAVLPTQVSVIRGRRSAMPVVVEETGSDWKETGSGSKETGSDWKETGSGSKETGSGSKETGSGSREPPQLAEGAAAPRIGTRITVARDWEDPESESSSEGELQPTDLSMRKVAPPPSRGRLEACGLRPSSVNLHRVSADQGKAAETASPPGTSAQAPSR